MSDMRRTPVDPETYAGLMEFLRPSVPTGDGDVRSQAQRFYDDYDQPQQSPRNALMRYGDQVIVPGFDEMGGMLLDGMHNAGEVLTAFPPSFGPPGPVANALGNALKYPRAVMGENFLRAGTASQAAERSAMAENALAAFRAENQARREMLARGVQEASYRSQRNMGPTVPNVDPRPAWGERDQVLDAIRSNPYVQPIPGRQGLPKKTEQVDLAGKYFERGGRLGQGGPWGRDMQEEIRDILRQASNRERNMTTGPRMNRPGAEDAVQGFRDARSEAEQTRQLYERAVRRERRLKQQIRRTPGQDGSSVD